jgi:hypothetical protein
MSRRDVEIFGLSVLDSITCGFGAVILVFMIINASVRERSGQVTADRQAEADRMQQAVLDGFEDLVEARNSVREAEDELVAMAGLASRLIEELEQIQVELAADRETTVARREHTNRLKADLKSLEEGARRLSGGSPSDETPGDRTRQFIGDGDRQYLTGLKVGGSRILILLDASASMLGDTIVNIVRRRNMPDEVKLQAEKWRQAVRTVDWLTTQLPRESRFQIYTFAEEAGPVLAGSAGQWLDASDRETLDRAVENVRGIVPAGGTNLHAGFVAIDALRPAPDNVILLVDGLPTLGKARPGGRTVTGKQRLRHFEAAVDVMPRGVPISVIMFPMEGDPYAASAFWKLAVASGGSYRSPAKDWP